MKFHSRRLTFLAVLIAGLVVRVAFLWMPGTEDMYLFRMWGAQALRSGLVHVYSLTDQDAITVFLLRQKHVPVHVRVSNPTDLGPIAGVPDYPPGNILVLEIATALCKLLQGGTLRAGPLLNACLNLPPVLFSLGIVLAVWFFIKKELAWMPVGALAIFWLHPAIILTSPILGYQDPIFAFLGLMSLILCYHRRYTTSVFLLALACLTKPQGAFVVPIVATALFSGGRWRALGRYGLRFALFGLVLLLPFIAAGRFLGIFAGVSQQVMYPALSAQQLNIWWLVGGVAEASRGASPGFLPSVITMISKTDFVSWAGFHPLWIALPAFGAFTGVNLYYLHQELRAGNRWALFWAAALEAFGYPMLMIYTHEHHLYAFFVYALPLLALGKGRILRLYVGLSILFGLNVFLFDGWGEAYKSAANWLRFLPGFDLTILVVLANIGCFLSILLARRWWFDRTRPVGPLLS
ncbi:MAG: hypothetical protein LAO07_12385 [Acidobacteriia bacterium]|nr:hypothetical protein [Terriglobia bacterium]